MKTTIYVTRHGETEWNVAKRMQGRKNSALTEKWYSSGETIRESNERFTNPCDL